MKLKSENTPKVIPSAKWEEMNVLFYSNSDKDDSKCKTYINSELLEFEVIYNKYLQDWLKDKNLRLELFENLKNGLSLRLNSQMSNKEFIIKSAIEGLDNLGGYIWEFAGVKERDCSFKDRINDYIEFISLSYPVKLYDPPYANEITEVITACNYVKYRGFLNEELRKLNPNHITTIYSKEKQGTARQLALAFNLMVKANHLPKGITDSSANARFIEFMTGRGFDNVRKELGKIKYGQYTVTTQKEYESLINDYKILKSVFNDVLFIEESKNIDKVIQILNNSLENLLSE